jgi:hypothetical protein
MIRRDKLMCCTNKDVNKDVMLPLVANG